MNAHFSHSISRKLLFLSIRDNHFVLKGKPTDQTDSVAMGSPLGPIYSNIFLCSLEESYLNGTL